MEKVVVVSVIGSEEGVCSAAGTTQNGRSEKEEEEEVVEIWVGGVDAGLDERGMIVPGLGDVGDRLYLTAGE